MKKLLVCGVIAMLLTACTSRGDADAAGEIAALRSQVEALQAKQSALKDSEAPKAELGQQMLMLQIRHARLWAAGEDENWLLAQFQLAELNEALDDVVEQNGDHAALQPQKLSVVLPAIMKPAVAQLRTAINDGSKIEFERAYDGLSNACSSCHQTADHGFLVIQRPRTPMLDNLRSAP